MTEIRGDVLEIRGQVVEQARAARGIPDVDGSAWFVDVGHIAHPAGNQGTGR